MKGYRLLCVIFILFHGLCSSSQEINGTSNKALMEKRTREKRILNIFSVVQFRNSPCQSTMTLVGAIGTTFRNGTCLTSAECAQQSGTASGSCASGFGVCCVFMISTCGATVTRNCSYIKNPGFPTAYTDTASCTFTIAKCDPSVCDFRLDFDQFTLNGPSGTLELNEGNCNTDSLTSTTTSGQATPVICGGNAGQHIYLDAGNSATGTAALNFAFTGAGSRIWDIKVTQIPCSANYKRPDGCLQYHTGIDGRLTTFNFDGVVPQHLDAQQYNVCIRQEEGYCCITYTPCATPTPSFALDPANTPDLTMGRYDTDCTDDFIRIEEGRCVGSASGRNIFCGGILSDARDATANCPIQDCTQPFQVGVFTNAAIDAVNTVSVANGNRGVCLEYTQQPC